MRLLKIKKIVDMKMIFSKIPELYTIALKGESGNTVCCVNTYIVG